MSNLYRFFCLFLLCCTSLLVTAQTPNPNPNGPCYVRLEDASGFNTDAFQGELEAAACALRDSFPASFHADFKVYDFGFYLHQEHSEGSYPEAMEQKIAEVSALSPYYLLFGKETGRDGVYRKIWVNGRLPETGEFICHSEISLLNTFVQLQQYVDSLYFTNNNIPIFYSGCQEKTMNKLSMLIHSLKVCCSGFSKGLCEYCPKESVENVFFEQKFTKERVETTISAYRVIEESNIVEYSDIKIKDKGQFIYCSEYLRELLDSLSNYIDVGLLITSNNSVCTMDLDFLQSISISHDFNIWINISHNFENPTESLFQFKVFRKGGQIANSIEKEFFIQFLEGCLGNYSNSSDFIVSSGKDIRALINDYFAFVAPPGPTPETISIEFWSYQQKINMVDAPVYSPTNTLDVKRNANYFFKQKYSINPEMFSSSNYNNVFNLKIAPIVDPIWVQYNRVVRP